ncbi:hypothetical protein ACFLYO_00075 [Chloroflexota bacterium]
MIEPALSGNVLNCIYGLALFTGLCYALFLIFFQGLGQAFDIADISIPGLELDIGSIFSIADPDIDLDVDSGDISGLSMLALSSSVTAFGAFGIAASTTFSAPSLVSLMIAILGGITIGAAAQIIFMRVLSRSTSSNIRTETLKGIDAEVTIPITGDGMGQVALVLSGQRITLIACSSSATDIKRGSPVIIDSVQNGVAYVSLDQDFDYFLSANNQA